MAEYDQELPRKKNTKSQKFNASCLKSSSAFEQKRGAGQRPPRGLNKTQFSGGTGRNGNTGQILHGGAQEGWRNACKFCLVGQRKAVAPDLRAHGLI